MNANQDMYEHKWKQTSYSSNALSLCSYMSPGKVSTSAYKHNACTRVHLLMPTCFNCPAWVSSPPQVAAVSKDIFNESAPLGSPTLAHSSPRFTCATPKVPSGKSIWVRSSSFISVIPWNWLPSLSKMLYKRKWNHELHNSHTYGQCIPVTNPWPTVTPKYVLVLFM